MDSLFEKSLSNNTIIEEQKFKQGNNKNNSKYNHGKYDKEENYSYTNYEYDYSSNKYYGVKNRYSNNNYNNDYNSNYSQNYKKIGDENIQCEKYNYTNYENTPSAVKNEANYENNYEEDINNSYSNQNYNSHKKTVNKYQNSKKRKQHNKVHTQEEKIKKQKCDLKLTISKLKYKAPELTYNLINELIESEYECMICNDVINQSEETWSCDKCFTIFHIKCIYDWISKLNSDKNDENKKLNKTKIASIFKWTCPHCSCNYNATTENLPKYNCFCKKYYKAEEGYKKGLEDYKYFNPNLIPHGCGIICNTKICKHVICELPCHPGPHLQCNEIEELICHCGHSKKEVSCNSLFLLNSSNRNFTCDKICDNILTCKRHRCKSFCHEGECESLFRMKKCEECTIEAKTKFMTFLRGLEIKIKAEGKKDVKFAEDLADYIFHGMLLCKNHFVETNTDDNLRLLLKLVQISGNSLIENIKKFIPLCKEIVTNSCNCNSKLRKTECYKLNYKEDLINFMSLGDIKEKSLSQCQKVCKSLKSCKNHTCDRVCCELANVKITNYSLDDPYGLHLCLIICGKELNCSKHNCENYCHRGYCLPCKTIIREGEIVCNCGHSKIQAPFVCGTKPQCSMHCTRERDCPHPCKLNCHDGTCPPCEELVIKMCNCSKTAIDNVRCGDKNLPKCNLICDEMLPCGAHFCDLTCHQHTDEYDNNYFCNLSCGRQFKYCKHICKKRCHGESDCWEIECDIKVKINCICKVNSKDFRCGEVKKLSNNFGEEYFLNCNDECKRIERLKKIEFAFDGLFKYNQEKNRQLLKGIGDLKNKEKDNLDLNKDDSKNNSKVIVRNWGNDKEENEENLNNNFSLINRDKDNQQENTTYHIIKISSKPKDINDINYINKENNKHEEYEEFNKRFSNVKFSYRNLYFAFKHVKFIIDLENSAEKALKNLTSLHEINSLDKKEYIFASEFLRTYYNIEPEKVKKGNDLFYHILLKNCHEGKIPRVKLSLLALLLKSHKFTNIIKLKNSNEEIPKDKIIYHPFEKSIYIQDYRLHVTPEAIDAYISNIVTTDNFYVNEIDKGKCYVHFFDEYNCNKVFKDLKTKPSQFQDCYEVEYYYNDNWKFEDFYLYLKNEHYFKYLNELEEDLEHEVIFDVIRKNRKCIVENSDSSNEKTIDQEKIQIQEKKQNIVIICDSKKKEENPQSKEDGFVVVTKKKKK